MPRTKKAEETVSCLKERLKKQHRTRKELEKINDMRYGKREVQTIADKQVSPRNKWYFIYFLKR